MPQSKCRECPWKPDSPMHCFYDSVVKLLEDDRLAGRLKGPHACHMMVGALIPQTPEQECAGHREYLEKLKNGTA
jgi:hypothetical protein